MRLKGLTFTTDNEDEGAIPKTVTVEMTVQEALWIARVSGKQRGESPHSGIFDCLIGDVFNRYWDDGVDEARKVFCFEVPPIVYED